MGIFGTDCSSLVRAFLKKRPTPGEGVVHLRTVPSGI